MSDVYDYYYENYLMLYSLYGRGRPRVSRERYEELDKELLDLVGNMPAQELEEAEYDRSTFTRLRDIEFLLLDDIAESLLERPEREGENNEARRTAQFQLARIPVLSEAAAGDTADLDTINVTQRRKGNTDGVKDERIPGEPE